MNKHMYLHPSIISKINCINLVMINNFLAININIIDTDFIFTTV